MSKVLVPLAGGFEEIEAVAIIDVLRRAEIEVQVASLDVNRAVKGANGITVMAEMGIMDVEVNSLDMVILPGGWDGAYTLRDNENIQNILKEMDINGKNIAAICAAPIALHQAGVLNQNYTCYPSAQEQIRDEGYMGDRAMVVQDGNVMTSRGPGTAICFALAIVKKLKGDEMYKMLKGGLIADFCEEIA